MSMFSIASYIQTYNTRKPWLPDSLRDATKSEK